VDYGEFSRIVTTIRRFGYKGKYTAPYNGRTMYGWYLQSSGAITPEEFDALKARLTGTDKS
jgi:hypothetical protein